MQFKDVLLHPETILQSMQEEKEEAQREFEALRQYLATCEKHITDLERQKNKLLELYLSDTFPKEMLDQKMQEIEGQLKLYVEKKGEHERRIQHTLISHDDAEKVRRYCLMASEGIEHFTFDDKRTVMDMLDIHGVVYRGEKKGQDVIVLTGFLPKAEDGTRSVQVGGMKRCKPMDFRFALSR